MLNKPPAKSVRQIQVILFSKLNVKVITPNASTGVDHKKWASSSVRIDCCNHQQSRIEHQPPKLGVEGSNPSSSATLPFLKFNLRVFTSIGVCPSKSIL